MRVGVVDVGANTVRLLVAEQAAEGTRVVNEQKARLSLGADIEATGALSRERIERTAECVRAYARLARRLDVRRLDVLITSPGRQARNGRELAEALSAATSTRAEVLPSEIEGQLAYHGAMQTVPSCGRTLVCDVGGGSTQLVVGAGDAISWQASLEIGSLRLTRRHRLARKAPLEGIGSARGELRRLLARVRIPEVEQMVATGGTARALARLCGSEIDAAALARAIERIAALSPSKLSGVYPVGRWRAERLLAGALILEQVQRWARAPIRVASGGIREGAILVLLERAAA
jgi:exopolyphosphatase/guanosine-5'-triphosphate,3'-diphosphate pyrophosphatase